MKYSLHWLQKHSNEPLPEKDVLIQTIIAHAFEVESVETTADGNDTLLEIKVLPDRAGDCLSHRGMAREIAGLLSSSLAPLPQLPPYEVSKEVEVHVTQEVCTRYCAVAIDGITVQQSPAWLTQALESLGQKSINTIVDIANFYLFDTGQPFHIFDADLISGALVVRYAVEGESITTLSGEEKKLTSSMLVIADQEKVLAIAGVKGGIAAAVSEHTTRIIVEAAHFDAVSIRKTARSLQLLTDAARRFENGVSPVLSGEMLPYLVSHILQLCGGTIVAHTDYYPTPSNVRTLSCTARSIARLLGGWVRDMHIEQVLKRYDYTYTTSHDEAGEMIFTIQIPYWRNDIQGVHDMAEEIGRVIGYDGIVPHSLSSIFTAKNVVHDPAFEAVQAIRAYLIKKGYSELYTYSFCKKGSVYVAHGTKDKSALRTSLVPAMKESYTRNKAQAPLIDTSTEKLFEIGNVFTEEGEQTMVCVCTNGGIEEFSCTAFLLQHNIEISTAQHSLLEFGILPAQPHVFIPWSVYPYIIRDIAVWLHGYEEGEHQEGIARIESIMSEFAAEYCVRAPVCFDTFIKDGRMSVAYRLVFQSKERTLTDKEVDEWFGLLTDAVVKQGYTIR